MPERKRDGPANPKSASAARPTAGSDDALREANRRLLVAALDAQQERDTQVALATAMRELLAKGAAGDQEFRAKAELLQTITANVSSALFLLDVRAHPLFLNPAGEAMFGYRLAEIKDAPLHEAVHHRYPDGRAFPIEECPIYTAIATQTALRDHRTVFVCKDGALLPVGCNVSPLRLAGLEVGAVLEVRDRTAEIRAEEAKRDFVAIIAHDLRTPLASVQGQTQLLQRRLTKDGQGESWLASGLESIGLGAQRMSAMIEELLETSRLESGVVPLKRAPLDLSELVAQVIKEVTPLEARDRVTLQTSAPAIVAFADAERIKRVVANLLSNALKYSPPDSPVEVAVRLGDGEATIAVVDHGMGIPSDQLPLLFQRFVRIDKNVDPGGLGLGLYIVRLIVEAHGGRVWAESEVGNGSTMSFALPLDPSDREELADHATLRSGR
jgi:two-component system phosphate regulon sensor histidine kinase PhoR